MEKDYHRHIKLYFDDNGALHICPKDQLGAMALKHWQRLYAEHGSKALEVKTAVPTKEEDPKPY